MAGVDLDQVWLSAVEDLSVTLSFYTAAATDARRRPGEVRRYAGGRLRIVTRIGVGKQITRTLRNVSDADLGQLEEWIGKLLLFRDHLGRKVYGTYFDLAITDWHDGAHEVGIVFHRATHSEAV